MDAFTAFPALLGGILIGLSVSLLYGGIGRVAGITGIVAGLSNTSRDERSWRLLFLAGLVAGGIGLSVFAPQSLGTVERSLPALALAGLLVGYGARLGGGCTSGHGVCGNSRLSARSLVATGVFIAAGALVVSITNRLFGGVL
jgi:uncharacterized membrane protein YedE/YeeE